MACRCDRETEGKHPCHGQGYTCTAWLILCLAELRWRDPRFKGVHRPLNIISSYPRKGY